jgi:hypothetical protein
MIIYKKLILFFALTVISYSQVGHAQTQPIKEWTFLVYMNSDNDLYRFSFLNMMQMEMVGSSAGVNIVVQRDPEPKDMPTTRYFVTQNLKPVPAKIFSQVVQTLPETDMGNSQTLADFLTWGVKNYPAKKYAVIIWNHGAGWQGVSYDDNPSTYLSMPMLRQGLEAMNLAVAQQRGVSRASGPLIDILNFDACIMSALEVAFEMRNVAKYLVGSQFNEPGAGENYTTFLQPLTAKPQMDAKELAEIMVYQYALNYSSNTDINYAAIDLSRVQQFVGLFDQTAKVMMGSSLKPQIKKVFGTTSFDLITGLTAAKNAASTEAVTADAIDQVIQMYGYPVEGIQRGLVNNHESAASLNAVTRTKPADVYYRYSTSGNWSRGQLKVNVTGQYQFIFPKGMPRQYFVVAKKNIRLGNKEIAAQEAVSTYLRDGKDPIVYHNQFPVTSPLIADAYTRATKGAHGMTLYSLAGLVAQNNPGSKPTGVEIMKQYKLLSFATTGSPQWTNFFGF